MKTYTITVTEEEFNTILEGLDNTMYWLAPEHQRNDGYYQGPESPEELAPDDNPDDYELIFPALSLKTKLEELRGPERSVQEDDGSPGADAVEVPGGGRPGA